MKLVIFDADGTLTPLRSGSAGDWRRELMPGVAEKCAALREQGVTLAIVSNQSKKRSRAEIAAQLSWTRRAIGARYVRWATTEKRRKPSPIMLLEVMRAAGVQASETIFVGDWETDCQAALAAGVEFAWARDFFA